MSGDHNQNQTTTGWRKRQIALNKKADNAREMGLDYEPHKSVIEMALEALTYIYTETTADEDELIDQAITAIKEALAQPEQKPTDIAALVQGMEVSIDVSTGDHDAQRRLFGTVTLVQQNQGSRHGLILLVQDPQPNFKAQPEQEPVAHLWECIGRWSAYLVNNGKQADCAPPSWLIDAVNNATTPPKCTWVDLTPQDLNDIFKISHTGEGAVYLALKIIREKNLKEQA